jgi:hypothetical protein
MIIAERFVMLNLPKTGSSFARKMIKELLEPNGLQRLLGRKPPMEELLMIPFRFKPSRHQYPSQHAVWSQIPAEHRNKPVVSIVRDPIDRLVSAYEFRHWERHPPLAPDEMRSSFPGFPDLSFEEFLRMSYDLQLPRSLPEGMRTEVGPLTVQYIRFFARDPLRTMLSLHDGMDLAAVREEHFAPVHYLHMENLREELIAFLISVGYSERQVSFIRERQRVNTTKRSQKTYFTPALTARVLHMERFLYQLQPEYATPLPA